MHTVDGGQDYLPWFQQSLNMSFSSLTNSRFLSFLFKTLEREIEGRKPVFEEIKKLGAKLLLDTAVRDEEKDHIQEEMEILEDRWKKLHEKIHASNKW